MNGRNTNLVTKLSASYNIMIAQSAKSLRLIAYDAIHFLLQRFMCCNIILYYIVKLPIWPYNSVTVL